MIWRTRDSLRRMLSWRAKLGPQAGHSPDGEGVAEVPPIGLDASRQLLTAKAGGDLGTARAVLVEDGRSAPRFEGTEPVLRALAGAAHVLGDLEHSVTQRLSRTAWARHPTQVLTRRRDSSAVSWRSASAGGRKKRGRLHGHDLRFPFFSSPEVSWANGPLAYRRSPGSLGTESPTRPKQMGVDVNPPPAAHGERPRNPQDSRSGCRHGVCCGKLQ